jgi:hypothetical protein
MNLELVAMFAASRNWLRALSGNALENVIEMDIGG